MRFLKSKQMTYIVIVIAAVLMALNYELFVFRNAFAPAGLNGLATMVQELFGFSVGYFSLIINIPLCVIVFILGERKMAVRSFVFTAVFSFALLMFRSGLPDVSGIAYHTDNGTSIVLAPVAAGVINGLLYGLVFRRNGSTGGTDLIAVILRKRFPSMNMVWLIFGLNTFVALISFFVYDLKFEPVIMCILYCFITSRISDMILKGFKKQIKFEIVTDNAEEISKEIIDKLQHTATLVHGKGMFSGEEKDVLICVVQKHQVVQLQRIIRKYPATFAYMEEVNEIYGNFNTTSRFKTIGADNVQDNIQDKNNDSDKKGDGSK